MARRKHRTRVEVVLSIEVIDASNFDCQEAVKAFYFLVESRKWSPDLTAVAIRAASAIVAEGIDDRGYQLVRTAEIIGTAVATILATRELMQLDAAENLD